MDSTNPNSAREVAEGEFEEKKHDGVDSYDLRGEIVPFSLDLQPTIGSPEEHDDDAETYFVGRGKKSVALIFNHKVFEPDTLDTRECADTDWTKLNEVLKNLNFEIRYHLDKAYHEVLDEVKAVAEEDHTDRDCLLVIVMTHGEEGGLLYARDFQYREEEVWKVFKADRVPSLAGKPKIFLFQCCRGKKAEKGVSTPWLQHAPPGKVTYVVPTNADFFIAHSTSEGCLSWNNPYTGSWFIQEFCAAIEKNASKKDLATIMTFVLQKVSRRFSSSSEPEKHMTKQMPMVTSTMTKLLYFCKQT